MKLHPVVGVVTQRIADRSQTTRAVYLQALERASQRVRGIDRLGCANVAHAFAAMPGNDPVQKVTILPRGRALGYTMVMPDTDKYSQTRGELLDQLAYMLGGRAAEELVFHDPTTGAANDIEKATNYVKVGVAEALAGKPLTASTTRPYGCSIKYKS